MSEALIPQFYAGRAVLVTGGTGFMGKVLVERLLSTCPEVGPLFLLLRTKRGVAPASRLSDLKASPVFDVLRKRHPERLDKLRVVPGDISRPSLGIPSDCLTEMEEVSVVFNCAATVKFDETMRRALEQNVLSVTRLLDLADQLGHVAAFVHVSTAYCNAERAVVEERVYELPRPLHQCIEDALGVPDDTPPEDVKRYIWPKPNTYTFTKMLAEMALQQHGNRGYPIAIFRPTIVVSSMEHPQPAWVESAHGAPGVVAAMLRGLTHVFPARGGARVDMLPVDHAIDAMIAVAWETAVDNSPAVRVYNCSTGENPTTWEELRRQVVTCSRRHPARNALWYPTVCYVQNRFLCNALTFLVQTVPLYAAEFVLRLTSRQKKRPNYIKLSQTLRTVNETLRYFVTNEWVFHTDNVRRLRLRLTDRDREIYNLDPTTIDWKDCYEKMVHGCRRHLCNNADDTLPEARARMRRLYILHRCITILVPLLIFRLVFRPTSILGGVLQISGNIRNLLFQATGSFTRFLPGCNL